MNQGLNKNNRVLRFYLTCLLMALCSLVNAQEKLIAKLQLTESVPAEILATKSVVIYNPAYSKSEIDEIQKNFAQTGIDAVLFVEADVILSGKDITLAYANYFVTREIKNLILLDKSPNTYRMVATAFNNKITLVEPEQGAWEVSQSSLRETLMTVLRNSWISQKKQNFLINEVPETEAKISIITGRRSEFFAIDLKADELAVPLFNDAALDTALKRIMKENYPFKYKLVPPVVEDAELRKKGFIMTLCMIKSRGVAAKKVLGYDMTKSESAYASTTYPVDVVQVKTIPAETAIYKFYVKHIPSGNVFLGTKWDADITVEQALKNYIKSFKAELKID